MFMQRGTPLFNFRALTTNRIRHHTKCARLTQLITRTKSPIVDIVQRVSVIHHILRTSHHLQPPQPRTMKLDTPEFHALFTPELRTLIALFEKNHYELRIAGGAVRDMIMKKACDDVDFATTATPDQMKAMFEAEEIRMINTKGESHGTITCRINDKENFEVTTLRIDVTTDGRHADVEFTTNWQLDALRRDLTINQMFLGFDGTVYDHYNGIADLEVRKVCFVGDAESRIQEDYLRILRYFRFFGRISVDPDSHEAETLRAIKDNMHGLTGISGERIWVEVKKIIIGRHADRVIATMMNLGLAKYIGVGDLPNTDKFQEIYTKCHDLDPSPLTLIPALLENENQVYTFHERVKLSRDELRTGLFIISHRDDDMGNNILRHCQHLHCDTVGKEPKTKERIIELLKYLNEREALVAFRAWNPPRFPVGGHTLLSAGVKRGPELKKVIAGLREIWKLSDFSLNEEELLSRLDDVKANLS